jgi:hypothetical protein
MLTANPQAARLAMYAASIVLWSTEACAQADSKLEREKRHVVSRMHQLLHVGKRDCQNATAAELQQFNDGLASLRARNKDFFQLFEASPYFLNPQGPYNLALEGTADPQNCGAALWLLNGLLDPEGQKVMQSYAELLRK